MKEILPGSAQIGAAERWRPIESSELNSRRLEIPLRWRKRRFVALYGDLFHESLPDGAIAAVFGVMAACPQHTFQVLTKRPERTRLSTLDEWWRCPDCGPGVKADEDGCCANCGADLEIERRHPPHATTEESR